MTASFSRALTEGLRVDQVPAAFTAALDRSVREIYDASVV
jgi:fructose-bisphosphate aldolase class 1